MRATQLNNFLSSTSRGSIFYAAESRIITYDSVLETAHTALDLSRPPPGKSSVHTTSLRHPATITSIATSSSALIAGTDCGNWVLRSLCSANSLPLRTVPQTSSIHRRAGTSPPSSAPSFDSPSTEYHTGSLVTPHEAFDGDNTTNHITIHPHRQAAILGTEQPFKLTTLDLNTLQTTATHSCPFSPHASALSPCARLHLVVGDDNAPLILDANSGKHIVRLPSQAATLTSALWADDSLPPWVFATGNSAGEIILGDARSWGGTLAHHRLHRIDTHAGAAIYTMRACRNRLVGSAVDGLLWSIDLRSSIDAAISSSSNNHSSSSNNHSNSSSNSTSNTTPTDHPPPIDLLGMTGEIAGLDVLPADGSLALALARPRIWKTRAADFWRERRQDYPLREPGFWNEGAFWGERRRGLGSGEGLGVVRVGLEAGRGWKGGGKGKANEGGDERGKENEEEEEERQWWW